MARKKKKNNNQQMELNITSMMDMFTIILVFLLKSYSTDAETKLDESDRLTLPVTISMQSLDVEAPSVIVAKDGVYVGTTNKVADLNNWELVDSDPNNPYAIPALMEELEKVAERQQFIADRSAVKFEGIIIIQADREMPSSLLTKVMFSIGQSGFSKIKLAAISEKG